MVATDLRTFAGEPVSRVEVGLPQDVPPLRARLAQAGVECFEADLRFAYRYLIDRGIRGGFTVDGPFERRPGVGRVYRNPELAPARLRAAPPCARRSTSRPASTASRLYSVAMAGEGGERVLMVGPGRSAARRACRTSARCWSASSPISAPSIPTSSPAGTCATST